MEWAFLSVVTRAFHAVVVLLLHRLIVWSANMTVLASLFRHLSTFGVFKYIAGAQAILSILSDRLGSLSFPRHRISDVNPHTSEPGTLTSS